MCISSVINQLIFQPCPGSETQPLDAFWVKVTTRLDPVENPALGSPSWRISVGSLCLKLDPGAQNVSFSTGRNPISVFHPWISHGTHKVPRWSHPEWHLLAVPVSQPCPCWDGHNAPGTPSPQLLAALQWLINNYFCCEFDNNKNVSD